MSSATRWRDALLIVIASLGLFLFRIGEPQTHNFDEFHYVPAARELLELGTNRNWEHPPLGKYFIAAGMAVFGDTPLGWRAFPALFGALTLGLIYLWAALLFNARRAGMLAALLALLSQMILVQARMGTLDVFTGFFAVLAGYWGTELWRRTQDRLPWAPLLALGMALGCGAAVKWYGLLVWAGMAGLLWLRHPRSRARMLVSLAGLPSLAYVATFLPLLALRGESYTGLWDLVLLHKRMWEGMRDVGLKSHGYKSEWWEWPLLNRPIWYHYERSPDQRMFRGVLLLGNPLIFWLSPLYLGWAAWRARRDFEARRTAGLCVAFWALYYFTWAVVPRDGGFFYYYYAASLALVLTLTWTLIDWETRLESRILTHSVLVGAGLLFVWYFPVLTGAWEVPVSLSRAWMWFQSWI